MVSLDEFDPKPHLSYVRKRSPADTVVPLVAAHATAGNAWNLPFAKMEALEGHRLNPVSTNTFRVKVNIAQKLPRRGRWSDHLQPRLDGVSLALPLVLVQ